MLLCPNFKSKRDVASIVKTISYVAMNPSVLEITENSSAEDIALANYLNGILEMSSIYQYQLPELPNGKIILDTSVYDKLCEYANSSNSKDDKMIEFGGYLYGKEISPNTIVFKYNNLTEVENGEGVIETPEKLCEEIKQVIEETNYNCVAHIHTHPFKEGYYSLFPSNQDLYAYAYLQENFNTTDKDVFFLGGLITPLTKPGSKVRLNDLCFIFYDTNTKFFYKCDNIFYKDKDNNIKPLSKALYNYEGNDFYDRGKVYFREKRTILQNADKI